MISSIWNWLDHGKCSLWQVVGGEGFKSKSDLKYLLCITTFLGNINWLQPMICYMFIFTNYIIIICFKDKNI